MIDNPKWKRQTLTNNVVIIAEIRTIFEPYTKDKDRFFMSIDDLCFDNLILPQIKMGIQNNDGMYEHISNSIVIPTASCLLSTKKLYKINL